MRIAGLASRIATLVLAHDGIQQRLRVPEILTPAFPEILAP